MIQTIILHLDQDTLIETLRFHGSSLIMNWGEDTGCWEVSWITGGKRYTEVSKYLIVALRALAQKAMEGRL